MCKFFYPDGTEIGKDEFIRYYSSCYYIGGEKIPRLSPNSHCTENEIDRLLKQGIKVKIDVVHILAWKLGKINHKESEKSGEFEYASDWKRAEDFDVARYGKPFEIERIAEFICDNIGELEGQSEKNAQTVLNRLRDEKFYGLGSVYLITLLYFISKGHYPIYDRFAQMALGAILKGVKPGDIVQYAELPEKSSRAFSGIMAHEMSEYIKQMHDVFKDEYMADRDIDRALWVYGHLFKTK